MTSTNVNTAFNNFMANRVRLDPVQTDTARQSRNWMLEQLRKRASSSDHPLPTLHPEEYVYFGSFSRRTKTRPLNDIDIMIIMHAYGNSRTYNGENLFQIELGSGNQHIHLCFPGTRTINSKLVVNQFVSSLKEVSQYGSATIGRRQQAAVLKLLTHPWTFDIVPAFKTMPDEYGREFYLIPDGNGNWMGSNPPVDQGRVSKVNINRGGKVLDIIRLVKYWSYHKYGLNIPSYLLEVMIVNYYEMNSLGQNYYIDSEFIKVLNYLSSAIQLDVMDPKGLVTNINHLAWSDRRNISSILSDTYNKALDAQRAETNDKNHIKSIRLWKLVLGSEFGE